MHILVEMQRTLGRIEGQTQHIPKIMDRVAQLEIWQSWLKGACAVLMVALGFLCKLLLTK